MATLYIIVIAAAAFGYLIGSVPFGLVFTRLAGLGDIRKVCSGNIGATNVLRTGKKGLTILVLICDMLKGAAAVWGTFFIIVEFFPNIAQALQIMLVIVCLMAGLMAVVGHSFPVWLKFKGGKGVAATFGFMLATAPVVGLLALITWLAAAIAFRISSLAALAALALAPLYAALMPNVARPIVTAYIVLAALGYVRHKDNIKRLLKGEESKINFKTQGEKSESDGKTAKRRR